MEKEKIIGSVISGILMRFHLRLSIHKEKDGQKHVDCDISINSPEYQHKGILDKSNEMKKKQFLTFDKQ